VWRTDPPTGSRPRSQVPLVLVILGGVVLALGIVWALLLKGPDCDLAPHISDIPQRCVDTLTGLRWGIALGALAAALILWAVAWSRSRPRGNPPEQMNRGRSRADA
jgi:hypothetical protein